MLDNILHQMRRSAERVQRRGEELTQSARLRLEVFGLSRELEGLYARLGRAYHAGADSEVLQGIQDEIRRVDEEISAREHLIQELGSDTEDHANEAAAVLSAAPRPNAEAYDVLPSERRDPEPLDSERQRERER